MSNALSRRLLLAVLASVLVHAGLLLTVSQDLPPRLVTAAASIEARLNIPDRAGLPVAPLASSATQPAKTTPAEKPRRGRPRLAVRDSKVEPAAVAPAALAPAASPPSVAVKPAVQSGAAGEALSPDGLRQYRVALAIAARRYKHYPSLASERGWGGTVEVAVSVSAGLPAPTLLLLRSSGRAVLDEQALWIIEQAALKAALPESLLGRSFRVVLPIEFAVDKDR